MTQINRLSKNNTTIKYGNGYTAITLHSTEIVNFTPDLIFLNTGGWNTSTTKTRMNQASNQFNLGYRVYQEKGGWFVNFKGNNIPFNKEMDLTR